MCGRGAPLKIAGSSIVSKVVSEAAQILRSEKDMEIEISEEGGTAGGIAAVGQGHAAIGMISRELTGEDRADWPGVKFTEIVIGTQVIALGVGSNLGSEKVRAVSAEQMQAVYEGRLKNWKDLGGRDQAIVFFDWQDGRGVSEMLGQWLYGDNRKAPISKFEKISSDTEARNSVEFTPGAISPLSALLIDGRTVFALGLKTASGEVITPGVENLKSGKYPMMRPLILIVNDKPVGAARVMVDFILSPRGQKLLKKYGFYGRGAFDNPQPAEP